MKKIKNFEIRAYMRIRNLIGISSQNILIELKSSLADQAPSKTTIYKCVDRFKKGGESLEDQRRSKTALTYANIKRVDKLAEENPCVIYEEIKDETSLHPPTIKEILYVLLNLKM